MNGVRSRKTVGGVAHDYVTQNGRVIQERYGTNVLQFVYGTDGNPYAMRYSQDSGSTWQTFYYILNLQGDVVKLVDANGTVCAEYSYDAWGKCLSQTTAASCAVANLAEKNPIRYRGYYYDAETGWYYLQSRYYDPIVKRFINADSYATTPTGYTGCNMFAYCNNNPVANADPFGYWGLSSILKTIAVAAAAVAVVSLCVATAGVGVCAAMTVGGAVTTTTVATTTSVAAASVGCVATGVTVLTGFYAERVAAYERKTESEIGNITYSKGGRQNIRDTGLRDLSDQEISQRLRNPSTPKSEKQRLKKEEKARHLRNVQKRGRRDELN